MAFSFASVVSDLMSLGFYDFVLPWVLFFAVMLGLLNKSKVIGDPDKGNGSRTNAIVAAAVAFFIVAFTPAGGIAAYYSTLFGVAGMIVGVLLLIVILGGVLGFSPEDLISKVEGDKKVPVSPWIKPLIGLVIIIFAVFAFSGATGNTVSLPGLSSDLWTLLFILVFVGLVIWFATSGGKGGGTPPPGGKPPHE